jgi:hypothetical protein
MLYPVSTNHLKGNLMRPINPMQRNSRCSYQALEPRQLLAGNVTVFKSMHLYIRGDAADNQFEIVADGDELRINGLNGTTINNEASYLVRTARRNENGASFAGGLRAHLGPGHDELNIRDAHFEELSIIYGGTGDDDISLADSVFSGPTTIQTFDGQDSINVQGTHFEDSFRAVTLKGRDSIVMKESVFSGDSITVTGMHTDSIHSANNHYMGEVNLLLTLGGNDEVLLENPVVGEEQLGVFMGNEDDLVKVDMMDATVDGSVRIGGQAGTDSVQQMSEMSDAVSSNVSIDVEQVLLFDSVFGGSESVTSATTSYYNAFNDNYRYASEFRLETDSTVRRVSWAGSYSGFRNEIGEAFVEDDFRIEFYEGNTSVPLGDPIAVFEVGNEVNRTATGFEVINGGRIPNSPIFEYWAEIDIDLQADKTYWISISGATEEDVPQGVWGHDYNNFQWANGLGAEDYSFAYTFGQPNFTPPSGWFNDFGPGPAAYDFELWAS